MAEALFWVCVGLVVYTYAGYPLLIRAVAAVRPRPVEKADITPPVTVIVAAYNEEQSIAAKLETLLAQDYPKEALEILVASDGSTDRTDAIVTEHAERGVRLLHVAGRKGKTAAQNEAMKAVNGEVVVFTDATTEFAPDAVRRIVRPFADPRVGCVGGELTYVSKGGTGVGQGGTSYWGYERSLKRTESAAGSLIGVSGCFYAVRKAVYKDIPPHLISDFVIALNTHEAGLRTVYEDEARCWEETLEQAGREFSMRIRVALRSYGALWEKRHLLNPFRHGLFAVQLLSHKVLRYAVSLFLVGILASSVALAREPFYALALAGQVVFYGAAVAGHLKGKRGGLLAKPHYFLLANLAALVALFKFLKGERMVVWQPIR
jgi:cellulose synthase/poly-beta-1,6-N-acetylglucosamine synthase-like glycosyltransferase